MPACGNDPGFLDGRVHERVAGHLPRYAPEGSPLTSPLCVLHIAHVRWFNAEAQYALDLAQEMARRGHRIGFLAQAGSPAVERARRAGLETFEEAGFNEKGFRSLRSIGAAVRLTRFLRAKGFDAVEVHRPDGLPLIVWACRRAGVPVVRVRGDMRPVRSDPLNRFLYRRLLDGVVASNTAIEASLRSRLGKPKRLVTIHGGVDPEDFTPKGPSVDVRAELNLPSGSLLVGILGRLSLVKGHKDFLDAARIALGTGADASFVVLNKFPSPAEEELRAIASSDFLLAGRVGFLGYREDLPSVLRAFDLGVVASTGSEANCRVGLEWMASGAPLVATRVGVLPDLVVEGVSGFLLPPGAPSSLAERIVYLTRDRAEARRLGEAARLRVLDRFTMAHCASGHEALLRDILRDHRDARHR